MCSNIYSRQPRTSCHLSHIVRVYVTHCSWKNEIVDLIQWSRTVDIMIAEAPRIQDDS